MRICKGLARPRLCRACIRGGGVITDTDVFKHVLAIIRVVYRGTKDEALKSFIKTELQRVSGKDQHVDDALKSCERFDKMTESLNRR